MCGGPPGGVRRLGGKKSIQNEPFSREIKAPRARKVGDQLIQSALWSTQNLTKEKRVTGKSLG